MTTRDFHIRRSHKSLIARIVCYPSRGGVIRSEDFDSYKDITKGDCTAYVRALCDLGGGVMTVVQGDEVVSSMDV